MHTHEKFSTCHVYTRTLTEREREREREKERRKDEKIPSHKHREVCGARERGGRRTDNGISCLPWYSQAI